MTVVHVGNEKLLEVEGGVTQSTSSDVKIGFE